MLLLGGGQWKRPLHRRKGGAVSSVRMYHTYSCGSLLVNLGSRVHDDMLPSEASNYQQQGSVTATDSKGSNIAGFVNLAHTAMDTNGAVRGRKEVLGMWGRPWGAGGGGEGGWGGDLIPPPTHHPAPNNSRHYSLSVKYVVANSSMTVTLREYQSFTFIFLFLRSALNYYRLTSQPCFDGSRSWQIKCLRSTLYFTRNYCILGW